MRTGGGAPPSPRRAPAASRCGRDRRCRRRPAPPCGSARSRAPRPRRAATSATACSMQRAAAAPARASTLAERRLERGRRGRPSACSTGMQRGGSAGSVGRRVDPRHRQQPPVERRGAAHHADVADDEQPAALGRAEPAAMISGPMPQASPIVRTSGRRARKPCAIVGASRAAIIDQPTPRRAMRKAWLLFSQTVTIAVALLFVVATLKPGWLKRGPSRTRRRCGGAGRVIAGAGAKRLPDRRRQRRRLNDAAKRASPAVVSITASRIAQRPRARPGVRFFFGDRPRQAPRSARSASARA